MGGQAAACPSSPAVPQGGPGTPKVLSNSAEAVPGVGGERCAGLQEEGKRCVLVETTSWGVLWTGGQWEAFALLAWGKGLAVAWTEPMKDKGGAERISVFQAWWPQTAGSTLGASQAERLCQGQEAGKAPVLGWRPHGAGARQQT